MAVVGEMFSCFEKPFPAFTIVSHSALIVVCIVWSLKFYDSLYYCDDLPRILVAFSRDRHLVKVFLASRLHFPAATLCHVRLFITCSCLSIVWRTPVRSKYAVKAEPHDAG